jgi:hypothetical protein
MSCEAAATDEMTAAIECWFALFVSGTLQQVVVEFAGDV